MSDPVELHQDSSSSSETKSSDIMAGDGSNSMGGDDGNLKTKKVEEICIGIESPDPDVDVEVEEKEKEKEKEKERARVKRCKYCGNYHRPKPKDSSNQDYSPNPKLYSLSTEPAHHQKYDQTQQQQQQQQGKGKGKGKGPPVGCNDLLKHMPNWSETGKRSAPNPKIDLANIIYDAAPLRACYGLIPCNSDTQDSEQDSNQYSDLSIRHLFAKLNNPKRSKSNKTTSSVHQCEICGKIFETGQALGGHKSYHRSLNSDIESLRQMLLQRKPKHVQQPNPLGIFLFGTDLSQTSPSTSTAHHSQQSSSDQDQQYPAATCTTLLDFDLNIPFQG
ncbi:hypothetical protein CCACVL1_02067 [Corchorus capsularis]|uniref:C2H2-type domain-containing protein n=1 Tax=Corchorus capsularis TaxID=210143 RepID=A0A1R3KD99_COCAP|nr:hypothetical protein CCACVL1_02067 [Corchorus capsularis]